MSGWLRVLLLMSVLVVAGCADYSLSRAMYEGIQTRDQLQTTPSERGGAAQPMNYQQYESERKRPQ